MKKFISLSLAMSFLQAQQQESHQSVLKGIYSIAVHAANQCDELLFNPQNRWQREIQEDVDEAEIDAFVEAEKELAQRKWNYTPELDRKKLRAKIDHISNTLFQKVLVYHNNKQSPGHPACIDYEWYKKTAKSMDLVYEPHVVTGGVDVVDMVVWAEELSYEQPGIKLNVRRRLAALKHRRALLKFIYEYYPYFSLRRGDTEVNDKGIVLSAFSNNSVSKLSLLQRVVQKYRNLIGYNSRENFSIALPSENTVALLPNEYLKYRHHPFYRWLQLKDKQAEIEAFMHSSQQEREYDLNQLRSFIESFLKPDILSHPPCALYFLKLTVEQHNKIGYLDKFDSELTRAEENKKFIKTISHTLHTELSPA